ncbi:MAG: hypothetical protein FJ387_31200 [Verrucomicrobia bacterium]|nr:hypothetical protein [Verrucomicrobiota bacterium]
MSRPRRVAVLANVSRRFDRRVIQGVTAYMWKQDGWSLYVEEDPLQKLPELSQWDGDGIIADFDDHKIALAVRGRALPVIGFGGGRGWYDPACGAHYFTTDNAAIGRLAADHLLDCGFTQLAFYGNPPRRRARWSEEREQAFGQRAAAARVPWVVYLGRHADAHCWLQQLRELSAWLKSLPKPIGLMACTDIRARQVLEACRTSGIRVPDEVAVIGVGNVPVPFRLSAAQRPAASAVSRYFGQPFTASFRPPASHSTGMRTPDSSLPISRSCSASSPRTAS